MALGRELEKPQERKELAKVFLCQTKAKSKFQQTPPGKGQATNYQSRLFDKPV
jgi:hypothetical protein